MITYQYPDRKTYGLEGDWTSLYSRKTRNDNPEEEDRSTYRGSKDVKLNTINYTIGKGRRGGGAVGHIFMKKGIRGTLFLLRRITISERKRDKEGR